MIIILISCFLLTCSQTLNDFYLLKNWTDPQILREVKHAAFFDDDQKIVVSQKDQVQIWSSVTFEK